MTCRTSLAAAALFLPLGACALTAPPAEQFLDEARSVDAQLHAALERSRSAPADFDAALVATRLSFQAAELRLQQAQIDWLDANPGADVSTVMAADDEVTDPARTEILSLATAGLEAAERAAKLRPEDAGALLHQGLHFSLIAWANGPARSLFAGYGPRLVAAIDASIAADPTVEHSGPLRLRGRFRGKAPWPYGDLDLAERSLQEAVADHPVLVNRLFLGDVLWLRDKRDEAIAQWRAALDAPASPSVRWSADLLREQAKRRLAATAQ